MTDLGNFSQYSSTSDSDTSGVSSQLRMRHAAALPPHFHNVVLVNHHNRHLKLQVPAVLPWPFTLSETDFAAPDFKGACTASSPGAPVDCTPDVDCNTYIEDWGATWLEFATLQVSHRKEEETRACSRRCPGSRVLLRSSSQSSHTLLLQCMGSWPVGNLTSFTNPIPPPGNVSYSFTQQCKK